MRRSVALVAVLLVYLMVPGSLELTESLAHLVVHGDTAHADVDDHEKPGGDDEHGCSGGYHLCVCHHTTGFIVSPGVHVERPALPVITDPVSTADLTPSADVGRIFRPPIA
jgi:hypothetical protein